MKLSITLFGVLVMNLCFACDFCGCFMGITPYDNQSNIRLLYRYKSFNGYGNTDQPHLLFPQKRSIATNSFAQTPKTNQLKHGSTNSNGTSATAQKDYEIYTSVELRANYFIHSKIEISAIVPLALNSSKINAELQNVRNLSDITILAGYRLVEKILTEKYQHRLIIGAGIKLPTGSYLSKSDDGDRIDLMLQSGTGSTDYLGFANYIFSYKNFGINYNSTFKFNGENNLKEKVGCSSANYLNVFFKLRSTKKLKLFPALQGYYEYSNGLFIDGKYQNGSSESTAYCGAGIDLFYKNLSLNSSFQLPFYENTNSNNLASAGKFMIGLTFSLNQKKHLIKSGKTKE